MQLVLRGYGYLPRNDTEQSYSIENFLRGRRSATVTPTRHMDCFAADAGTFVLPDVADA